MKVETNTDTLAFQPLEIKISLETHAEVYALAGLLGSLTHNKVGHLIKASVRKDANVGHADKLVSELYYAANYHLDEDS